MSVEYSASPKDEARKEAEKILRFKIGTQYSLGDPVQEDSKYIFPVEISLPRVIFNETRTSPVKVNYLTPEKVGEIIVDESNEVEYTHPQKIYSKVRNFESEIQEAVEKALITSSAKDFTKLPFPENRYAPVEDLLSEVILRDKIPLEDIAHLETDEDEDGKYTTYINELVDIDLVRRESGAIVAGNVLADILRDTDQNHEALNGALAHYFKENVDNIDTLHTVLGPYLAIAGFYYRLALESDQIPVIDESDLRKAFKQHYGGRGKRTDRKAFKMSRYLLHLERAGILKTRTESNGRLWYGKESIKSDLEDSGYVSTITPVQG